MRIGIGYDIHRLVPERKLRLGGVDVPCEVGLLGHSDGDVLLHAICDALLGAAGLGDIGEQFPDTDPAYKDIDSTRLLAATLDKIHAAGYRVVNVDTNILAERPRLKAHKPAIRARLAALLGLDATAVGLKARTHEGLDAIGRGEAIAAHAVVLLDDQPPPCPRPPAGPPEGGTTDPA